MEREISFGETVAGLLAGDFTQLAPLFDGAPESSVPIIGWYEEGRFSCEQAALAEAFTCACFNGYSAVVRYFLERGVDPCGGANTGLNACHWAANRGQEEVVEILVRSGAPLEIPNAYGGTVLGSAVWAAVHEPKPGHLRIIETLLEAGVQVHAAEYPSGREDVDAILRRFGAAKNKNA